MTEVRAGLLYTEQDEWVKVDGDIATIGITDYAQDSLSDIVFLELPDVGDSFGAEDTFGVVESVKAAADLYMPVAGEVTETNEPLLDTPEMLNDEPYEAWLVKIKVADSAELDSLMDAEAYSKFLEERD